MSDTRNGTPVRVLLVDDDPAEHVLLRRKLEKAEGKAVDLVPNNDFRETAPQLRQAGFIGPIGIISSDISGKYFEQIREYGVDFKIGKDEIDRTVISFIVEEYTKEQLSDTCSEDYM